MSSNSVREIFKESIDKLNSILMYLDHQLGTVSLTKEEIDSLGGVKNTVEPLHTILEEQKGGDKKGKKKEKANINCYQGTATNLSKFKDNSYDIVLLFGPMYHLLTMEEKIKALEEAKRVSKKYIFISY